MTGQQFIFGGSSDSGAQDITVTDNYGYSDPDGSGDLGEYYWSWGQIVDMTITGNCLVGGLHYWHKKNTLANASNNTFFGTLGGGYIPSTFAKGTNGNEVIKDALGPVICDVFKRAKWAEVDEYRTRVTDWEISRYLELA